MLRRHFLCAPALLAQIKVEVNLVNVPFTVRDESGKWITNLSANDFDVFEDGIQQKVSFFSRASESPLSIAVVADVSGSQEEFLKDHRRDLRDFLKTVITNRDQAALVCFGNSIRLASPFQGNVDRFDEALKDYQKGKNISQYAKIAEPEIRSGGTAFYDAIVAASAQLKEQQGRRAMLIFSDGEDNSSARNLMDAVELAQLAGVTVFSLRYTEIKKGVWTARNKYGRSVMSRLAIETGGLEFDAGESSDLRDSFRQIADLLRASYDLAYQSSQSERDNTFRKIRIRAKQPGLITRHKSGYYARP
ncbi:MAG: VWA domain-containing protein [Acidobacteria bacterium]|nr:VWA domain-containing protein [Acidobacteriota bacterium]